MNTNLLLFVSVLSIICTLVHLEESVDKCIQRKPANCLDILQQGNRESGVYTIYPWAGKYNLSVYCDMDTDGGGWIVFQRRDDIEPRLSFFQHWKAYNTGFGELTKEFWLGNHHLYVLTNQDYVALRVDLEDFEGNRRHALYQDFNVEGCQHKYKLKVGNYYGDAGDNLRFHSGAVFSTFDDDNEIKCSSTFKSGWWFGTVRCHEAHLNGLYLKGNTSLSYKGVHWHSFRGANYSLKKSEMKFRPAYFP